jgi:hypothetical protein
MSIRKYIRIALTPEDVKAFSKAKADAEASTMVAMSDAMFALSIIRKAIAKTDDTA